MKKSVTKRLSTVGALVLGSALMAATAYAASWRVYGWYGFTGNWVNIAVGGGKTIKLQNNNFQVFVTKPVNQSNTPPYQAVAICNDGVTYGGLTIPSAQFPNETVSTATCSAHGGVSRGAAYVLQ